MRMRNRIYLKSTLRQPLRSVLFLLLVGLLSAAFTVRTVEYVLIQRETARLGAYYRAIGSLQRTSREDYNYAEGANLIANSKYVALEDRRRSCSGVLQGMYNGDVRGSLSDGYEASEYDFGIHNSDVFIYGELLGTPALFKIGGQPEGEEHEAYQFQLRVDQVEAGYPENVSEGKTVTLYWITDGKDISSIVKELHVGGRYFLRAFYDDRTTNMLQWDTPSENLIVKPLTDKGPWFFPVEAGERIDLESPELAGLREELEVLRENLSAMLVVGTKDMSAMPNVQQASKLYYLEEGRWLDQEDDRQARKVCVVHREFADFRGLSVGDTITLNLRKMEPADSGESVNSGFILDGAEWKDWREFPTQTESFEIVGLYRIMLDRSLSTNDNTVMFVPDSCLPEGFGGDPQTRVEDYSFVLKSSQDEDAFLEENREALAELGFKVSFVENHGENFWASVTPMRQSSAFSAGVFAGVLLLGLVLVAFLYLLLRRRDFAILRAMGVPNGAAARGLLGPAALLGLLGIPAGGIPAWGYALGKTAETLAAIPGPEGVEVSVELSPWYLVGICGLILALLLAFVAVGAGRLSRRPALELLQGAAGGRKRRKKTAPKPRRQERQEREEAPQQVKRHPVERMPARELQTDALKRLPKGRGPGVGVSSRYVLRQIRRGPLKSALAMILALGFVVALGWMDLTAERSQAQADRLYETTVVEAEIVQSNPSVTVSSNQNIIREYTVNDILKTGLVQDVYLESELKYTFIAPYATEDSDLEYDKDRMIRNVVFCGTNQVERYCEQNGIEIEYAPRWSDEVFTEEWCTSATGSKYDALVLPANMLAQLGLELGNELMIYVHYEAPNGNSISGGCRIVGQYTSQNSSGDGNGPVLLGLSALLADEEALRLQSTYSVAEFVLDSAKNRELSARREELKGLVEQPDAGLLDLTLVLWDEELTQVVGPLEQNVRLMKVLYPVTAALSVLIAIGVSVLLLFQSAKEMAALRAMGCTRRRVGAMFSCQQGLLCLLGILLGLAALAALRGGMEGVCKGKTLLCAGLYFLGAMLGAVAASFGLTRRKPMELLQIKE